MAVTSLIFLLGYLAGLALAVFRHPLFGLYTYVAVFYLHPPSRWWGQFAPSARWALIAALVTLVATWRLAPDQERRNWRDHRGIALFIWFVVWIWLQAFWTISAQHGDFMSLGAKYAILLFLMYQLLQSWDDVRGFALVHVLGCLYLGVLAFLAPPWGRLEGVGGPGIDEANSLGMQLGTGLIFVCALLLDKDWRMKLVAIAAVPFIVNGIIQTESRGAILALVVAGGAMLVFGARRYRKFLLVCAFAGVLLLVRVAPDNFMERMTDLVSAAQQEQELDASASGRLVLIKAQFEMFLQYPMGTGHRGTAVLSPKFLDQKYLAANTREERFGGSRSSHNMFMSLLVEHGIPGLLLYLAVIIWALQTLRRLRAPPGQELSQELELYRTVVGGALVSVLCAGMFADYLKAEVLYWCLALVAVISELARRDAPVTSETEPAVDAPRPHWRAVRGPHGKA